MTEHERANPVPTWVFPRRLTDDERMQVDGYLQQQYGTGWPTGTRTRRTEGVSLEELEEVLARGDDGKREPEKDTVLMFTNEPWQGRRDPSLSPNTVVIYGRWNPLANWRTPRITGYIDGNYIEGPIYRQGEGLFEEPDLRYFYWPFGHLNEDHADEYAAIRQQARVDWGNVEPDPLLGTGELDPINPGWEDVEQSELESDELGRRQLPGHIASDPDVADYFLAGPRRRIPADDPSFVFTWRSEQPEWRVGVDPATWPTINATSPTSVQEQKHDLSVLRRAYAEVLQRAHDRR